MKRLLIFLTYLLSHYSIANGIEINDSSYHHAFVKIEQMLDGRAALSFKRAVFLSENAYLDNVLTYEEFNKPINQLVYLAKQILNNDDIEYDYPDRITVAKNAAIFRLLKDTTTFIMERDSERTYSFRTMPTTYDFDDFWGQEDWTKMFVTKLLVTNTGNCHSLPILYKILAEELGTKAYLAMAPNHTYIKHWSEKTGWYNTELTTGTFPKDADIKWSSYIKTEAVAKGVYMDTLSQKQSIAYVLTDLAQGYHIKYGEEDLETPLKWLDVVIRYYPSYPNAHILRGELIKKQLLHWMKDNGYENLADLSDDMEGKRLLNFIEGAFFEAHKLGYRKMPQKMYLNWLFRAIKKDTTFVPYRFATPQPFRSLGYEVQVVTASDGSINEFYDQDTLVAIGTVLLHRSTGRIVEFEVEEPDEDFPDEVISRMYDPQLGRFWQFDPLGDLREWLSPYNYVQNNPILRVDPTGALDDYFDLEGNYLGSDEADTDIVRVVDKKVWDQMKTINDDGTETVSNAEGSLVSVKHSEANLDAEQSLKIYDHYNPTDLPLENSTDPRPGASFTQEKDKKNLR